MPSDCPQFTPPMAEPGFKPLLTLKAGNKPAMSRWLSPICPPPHHRCCFMLMRESGGPRGRAPFGVQTDKTLQRLNGAR